MRKMDFVESEIKDSPLFCVHFQEKLLLCIYFKPFESRPNNNIPSFIFSRNRWMMQGSSRKLLIPSILTLWKPFFFGRPRRDTFSATLKTIKFPWDRSNRSTGYQCECPMWNLPPTSSCVWVDPWSSMGWWCDLNFSPLRSLVWKCSSGSYF